MQIQKRLKGVIETGEEINISLQIEKEIKFLAKRINEDTNYKVVCIYDHKDEIKFLAFVYTVSDGLFAKLETVLNDEPGALNIMQEFYDFLTGLLEGDKNGLPD